MATYFIKDLENLSGIKAHTIRIWEKRYLLLSPERTSTNIRTYSDADVRRLLNVSALIKSGFKISLVANYSEDKLRSEVLKLGLQTNSPNYIIDQLILCTVNFQTNEFIDYFNKTIIDRGFEDTIQNVVFPFLERIGILWQTGSIYTAHEHFISNLIRNRLIIETEKLEIQIHNNNAVFFLPENELHEIGLLYFKFLAKQKGVSGLYLGQSLPYIDLENTISKNNFDFVFTCFIQAIGKSELDKYILSLSDLFKKVKIFIAGRQLSIHKPKLPSNVILIKSNEDFNQKFI